MTGGNVGADQPVQFLIVDDDDGMRFLLQHELGKRDPDGTAWEVTTVATPEKAMELLHAADHDRPLVFLADYDLRATRTGADLLIEVRDARPDATRILFSGHPRDQLEDEIARAEPDAFLEKSVHPTDLVNELVDTLRATATPRQEARATEGKAEEKAADAPTRPEPASGATDPTVYQAIVDSISDYAIFMLDPQGHIVTWNPGAQNLKGYTAAEVIGKHFSIFYPETDIVHRKPQFELQVAAREGRFEDTGWRLRKDGSMFWANVIVTAIRNADGELIGYTKVTRDLTERKHHEEALRQSEERYRLLVASVVDYAIFMLDPQGRIVSWNAGAERIKGYTTDEILGQHFSIFYTPEDKARQHPQYVRRKAIEEGHYAEEGWRVRKDGTRFWASIVLTALFSSDGELRGFAKVTRDLTERKRGEEALRARADQLTDLARELEAFNYTVAHDLRAPLRAITHLLEVLLGDNAHDMDETERREILTAAKTSATRMSHLVEDLLTLSRATKSSIHREPVNVTQLAQAVLDEVKDRMDANHVETHVAPGITAHADPRLLRIALENLLSNAIKFSKDQPHPRVEIGANGEDGGSFYVKDNGVGFDPTRTEQIFRPFQRLHASTEFDGTGIGLATVQRLIHRHGGEISAESTPGHGATFHITLPHAETTPETEAQPDADA